MSQYPPPYPQPPQGGPYPASPYAPVPYGVPPRRASSAAQRAGVMLFVMGPLLLLFGGCAAAMAVMLPKMPPSPDLERLRGQLWATGSGLTLEALLTGMSVAIVAAGLALTILAEFVRRGVRGAVVTAIVLNGLILLVLGLNLLSAMAQMGSASALVGGCVTAFLTAAFVLQLVWLIAALRSPAGTGGGDAYQQYLAQWHQYQQNAQAYAAASGGYGQGGGYGAPPVGEPPPPPSPEIPPQG